MAPRHQASPTAARTDRIGRPIEFAPLLSRAWVRPPASLPGYEGASSPRFHIWTQGCQMNDADSEELARRLRAVGMQEVALEDADIAVLNTCVVRQASEEKLYGKFRQLRPWKRERPGRTIALTGCLAAKEGDGLRTRLPDLDLVFHIGETEAFVSLMADRFQCARPSDAAFAVTPGVQALVPIIHGCNFNCTYCIVPFVRGREDSRAASSIEKDVRAAVCSGSREVLLLGQTVNAYAAPDQDGGLPALLRRLDTVEGLERIRFITSHPGRMTSALVAAMAESASVCEHLHLPVQSGDDGVLRRMARAYRAERYMEIVHELREAIPDIALSTDVIVGFPGETDEAFGRTLDLVRAVGFDAVYGAAYSPRPRTVSHDWPDDVPTEIKRERLNRLLEVQREISAARNSAWIGRTVEVLVDRHENGRALGRTRQNRTVVLSTQPAPALGTLLEVTITAATTSNLAA